MKKNRYSTCLMAGLLAALTASSATAASLSFTNKAAISATSRLWSVASNWSPNQTPADGDTLIFGGSGNSNTNDLAGPLLLDSLIFTNGGNFFLYPQTAGNNGITVSNAIIYYGPAGAAAQRVNMQVTLVNPATIISNAGPRQLNFGEQAGSDIITGVGGVVIYSGAGTNPVVFYRANDYQGATVVNGNLRLGNAGVLPDSTTVTVNPGGQLDLNGKNETIDGLAGSGTVTNGGGSCTLIVGNSGSSTVFNGSIYNGGGTVSLEKVGGGTLTLNGVNTFSGETKISGGVLKLGVVNALQNSSVNLNGGNLSFSAATAVTLGGISGNNTVTLENEATADVALTLGKEDASTVTFDGAVSGAGSIIKTNANTQLLNGANSLAGSITIWGGTLGLSYQHVGGGAVVVKDGATLLANGDVGTAVNIGTLTAGDAAGCTLSLRISAGSGIPALNVTNLTTHGTVLLDVGAVGTFMVGTSYPLITYSGAIGGSGAGAFQLGTLPLGVVGHLQLGAGTVDLVIDAVVNSLTWTGSANNQWDTSSVNWQDAFAAPLTYTNQYGTNLLGDVVTFDDLGAAQPNVVFSTVLRPAKINWSAGSTDYSFSGSGANRLSGTGQAVKTGAGTVTLTTSNDYTGGTLINQGVVAVTHPQALGSEAVRVHSTLRFTNTAALTLTNSIYNNAGADMVFDVAGGTTATLGGALDLLGGGPVNRAVITKVGAGRLVLGGNFTIDDTSSRLLINSGDVNVVSPISFGGHGQCIAVANADNLASLTVDGSTLSVVGNYEMRLADGGGDGTVVITNGGTFTGSQITIGQGNTGSSINATGRVYQASGNVTLSGTVVLGPNNTFTAPPATPSYALYQLNGGILTTTGIQQKDPNVTAVAHFNGGTLRAANSGTLINPITTAQIQAGGLTVDTAGNSPSITMPLSGAGSLTKTGTGTLNLNTNNSYAGATVVAAGALGGSGSVAGNLIVTGGSFEPGVGVGTFAIGGSAWITNSALFQLNKNVSPSNDLATVTGALNVGGTLIVTNLGGALTNGDYFKLFSQPVSGSFSSLTLPALDPEFAWQNNLAVDGSLLVVLAPTSPMPTNIVVTTIPGQVILNWPAGQGWRVEAQTNSRAVGLTTNWANLGVLTPPVTNAANPANGTVFYRLAFP